MSSGVIEVKGQSRSSRRYYESSRWGQSRSIDISGREMCKGQFAVVG